MELYPCQKRSQQYINNFIVAAFSSANSFLFLRTAHRYKPATLRVFIWGAKLCSLFFRPGRHFPCSWRFMNSTYKRTCFPCPRCYKGRLAFPCLEAAMAEIFDSSHSLHDFHQNMAGCSLQLPRNSDATEFATFWKVVWMSLNYIKIHAPSVVRLLGMST